MQGAYAQGASNIAVLYNGELTKKAGTASDRFWLQGGALDLNVHLYRGLGIAAVLEGTNASSIGAGVNLSEVAYALCVFARASQSWAGCVRRDPSGWRAQI